MALHQSQVRRALACDSLRVRCRVCWRHGQGQTHTALITAVRAEPAQLRPTYRVSALDPETTLPFDVLPLSACSPVQVLAVSEVEALPDDPEGRAFERVVRRAHLAPATVQTMLRDPLRSLLTQACCWLATASVFPGAFACLATPPTGVTGWKSSQVYTWLWGELFSSKGCQQLQTPVPEAAKNLGAVLVHMTEDEADKLRASISEAVRSGDFAPPFTLPIGSASTREVVCETVCDGEGEDGALHLKLLCGHWVHSRCFPTLLGECTEDAARCPAAGCGGPLIAMVPQPQDEHDAVEDDLVDPDDVPVLPPQSRPDFIPEPERAPCTCKTLRHEEARRIAQETGQPPPRLEKRGRHTAWCPAASQAAAASATGPPDLVDTDDTASAAAAAPPVAAPAPAPEASATVTAHTRAAPRVVDTMALTNLPEVEGTILTYADVQELVGMPLLHSIPDTTRTKSCAAKMVVDILRATTPSATRHQALVLLAAFPTLVLAKPIKRANTRSESLSVMVLRRLHMLATVEGQRQLLNEAHTIRNERARLAASRPQPEVKELTVSEDAVKMPAVGDRLGMLGDEDVDVPEGVLKYADHLFERGKYSKGIRAMSAKGTAPPTPANAAILAELHPRGGLPGEIPPIPVPSFEVTKRDVSRAIHKVSGLSPGLSGWSGDFLLQLAADRAAGFVEALRPLIERLIRGDLPPIDRRFWFGARLFALHKAAPDSASLRPIAAGEIFRRMAGKIIMSKIDKQAGEALLERQQFAVGVKGGAEALIHAARRVITRYRESPGSARKVFLKADRRNAFNKVSRQKFLTMCQKIIPDALPYAAAAYGDATTLAFGRQLISSESGSQQGCPLAMMLYCLAEADAEDRIGSELKNALDMRGSYADDSNVAGDLEAVAAYHNAQRELAAEYGFEYRPDKYVVACHTSLVPEAMLKLGLPPTAFVTFDDVTVLGTCVGTDAAVADHSKVLADNAVSAIQRFTKLPNAHRASAALYFGGKNLLTHFVRTSPFPAAELERADDALISTAAQIYGVPATDEVRARLSLGYKEGGWGFRETAPYRDIAFMASAMETNRLQRSCINEAFVAPDDRLSRMVTAARQANQHRTNSSTFADDLKKVTCTVQGVVADLPRNLQSRWSKDQDASTRVERLRSAGISSQRERQRAASCAASWHALHPVVTVDQPWTQQWFTNPQLTILTRYRMGLEIHNDPRSRCGICGSYANDTHGEHAAVCMAAGLRSNLHNRVLSALFQTLTLAQAGPSREVAFPGTQRRIDIVALDLDQGAGTPAIDVAITGDYGRVTDPDTPGSVATAYEKVKTRAYGTLAARSGYELVPFVLDTYGAFGRSAEKIMPKIGRRVATRFDMAAGNATMFVRRHILFAAQMHLANILLRTDTSPDAARWQE